MNPKERYYSGVARETIHRITANRENWTSFLATMARNYDFTYPEQVMIYAQRPNATLCKPYEEWNTDQYRRYVKRGSTGIALFVMNQDKPYLRYVFDVADTGVRRSSPSITPWRVTDENRRFIMDEMERVFQVPSAEPEHFIDHYYVVEDLQVRGALQLKEYSTFEDAMRAYKSLPSERMKALGVQNTRTPFPGSLDLIQCKDGEDKLVQDYTKVAGWENPEILDLVQKIETAIQTKESPDIPAINFHITNDHLGEGGAKAKFRANMDAIRVLKELEFDERNATPEEQEILSQYVGWGGLAAAFDENKASWAEEFRELYTALSPEEYAAARASTLNAHYTSPTVIRAIYDAVGQMGFETGNILEPAMGIGNFFGMLPDAMRNSNLYGVELDSISGRIAQKLYPNAEIKVAGFETTDRRDFYDLAVGNVPFGNYKVSDKPYDKLGFSIHNYFFAKTLDQVRPGGVVAFVTSRFTMDSKNSDARKYMAQRAELLGAIRLPNTAFKANAGTEVVGKMVLKLVALPVLFVLGLICLLAKLVVNVSSFAIGALILYILGCCIYCVFQSLWLQLGLLVGIGLAVYAVLFLFVLFQEIGEHIKENLRDFIFS